ncbi:MAG: acetoacetate decarboxylase family protein [Actinomycetota bacterium]|nr:acetoacetate decarboxylase family protein [Actinomycetota bacterium]
MVRLNGFLFPRTATGRASLLTAPPWHYSGDLLTIEYRTDPCAIAELLPEPLSPPHDDEEPGAVALVFADWQSCADGFEEVFDPVRLQYKEAFFVVRCRYRQQLWSRCVYIWVDRDFALARGHLQGYPKKLGSIHMTRPVTVGKAGPRLAPGGRFGATLAASDRRLAEARFTITGTSETSGFVNGLPMLHHRWLPRIEADGTDSIAEIVTMRGSDVELGPAFCGEAELDLFASPVEELDRIAPREIIGGYWRSVGTTFTGGTTLEA